MARRYDDGFWRSRAARVAAGAQAQVPTSSPPKGWLDYRQVPMPTASRRLAVLVAVVFALLGIVLYLAPAWSSRNFGWVVSPFVAMTMGSWFLGGAFVAWRALRLRSWSTAYPGLVFLGAFGLIELLVLVIHRDEIRFSRPLGTAYFLAILASALAGVVWAVGWRTERGAAQVVGGKTPLVLKILSGGFFLLSGYFGVKLLLGLSRGGNIWPGQLALVTGRSFGAFYLALGLAVLPLVWSKTVAPILALLPPAAVASVLIAIPAFVYLEQFDFERQPGGLVYIGTYLFVLIVASAILLKNRVRGRASAGQ